MQGYVNLHVTYANYANEMPDRRESQGSSDEETLKSCNKTRQVPNYGIN